MQLLDAAKALKEGKIVAYPTEAVYGLGCDPMNAEALEALRTLKGRPKKPMILLANDWDSLAPFIDANCPQDAIQRAQATWPGPFTWVFPASERCLPGVTGDENTVAVRISAHPIAAGLAKAFGGAIVSTSANLSGEPPAKDAQSCQHLDGIAGVVDGALGTDAQPTTVQDALTGTRYRG